MLHTSTDYRGHATGIARAALDSVEPRTLVARALAGDPGLALRSHRAYVVCAVGKAAAGMLDAFEAAAPGPIRGRLCATGPHPTPDEESCRNARRALDLAAGVDEGSCLVLLVSGGASAMMALPAAGLTLRDKIDTAQVMLSRGFPIEQMNAVRKHLSAIKGGWLAARARACCTLAISDVIGPAEDEPSVIGSGPGVADPSTFGDAVRALKAREAWSLVPGAVRARLAGGESGTIEDTPKPGDGRVAHARAFVIGGRRDAMDAARTAAERLGYRVVVVDEPTLGEARVAGPRIVSRAMELAGEAPRVCVISSGETTVHVRGHGRGGRNQELALAALPALASARRPITLASVGTDGVDGPTDAAGALADERSLARAAARALPPVETALAENDAHPFFEALGDLVRTGPTGTNVGDLQVVLVN